MTRPCITSAWHIGTRPAELGRDVDDRHRSDAISRSWEALRQTNANFGPPVILPGNPDEARFRGVWPRIDN